MGSLMNKLGLVYISFLYAIIFYCPYQYCTGILNLNEWSFKWINCIIAYWKITTFSALNPLRWLPNLINQYFDFLDGQILGLVLKREIEKEVRTEQNTYIEELQPLITTVHLSSMKILFPSMQIEELDADGNVVGEIDAGDSSSDEFDPGDGGKSEASKKVEE